MKDAEKNIIEKRKELQKLRFGVSGAGAKNVKAMRNIRKDIARSMTTLRTVAK